jgi:hypothetical protein
MVVKKLAYSRIIELIDAQVRLACPLSKMGYATNTATANVINR